MPDIRHSITINAPAVQVYRLVSGEDGFSKWWAADVGKAGSGGAIEIGFFNRSTVYRLKPLRSGSPTLAEWACETGNEWAGTQLCFALSEKDGRSLLRFTHSGWREHTDYFIDCNTVWGHLMFRLKAAAEGRSVGPLFTETGLSE